MPSLFVSRLERVIAVALLAAIVALVFVASIMRFLDHPLIWSVDLAQLLFIWLCFFGANRALRQRTHLGVDLAIRTLGFRGRLIVELVLAVVVVAFLVALTVEGTSLMLLNRQRLFGDSGIPYAFVTIAVPAGSVLLILTIVVNAVEAVREAGRRGRLIFTRIPIDEEAGL
jgi:TRAP-type C4-dicarboxylate transport system permease small subunit